MDKNEKQKIQTTSQFNKYHQLLKRALQFLFSVSLLSFLLSYSSGISQFFHCFNFHFSTLLFPLFSQTIERKYVFLICNGIVAVLAKNLSFTTSSPGSDFSDEIAKTNDGSVKPVSEMEARLEDKEATMESETGSLENVARLEQEEEEQQEKGSLNIQVHERESPALIMGIEDEEEELEESGSLIPPLSAEDEGNEVNVSTEELNRKFDEFIRKMKEEIRIEARQQLIAV